MSELPCPMRTVRLLAGLSQREAAVLLGCQPEDVAYLEREASGAPAPEELCAQVDWPHVRAVLRADPAHAGTYLRVLDARGMRSARTVLGLTTREFAERAGIPYGTVAAWQRYQQEPRHQYRRQVAGMLRDARVAALRAGAPIPGAGRYRDVWDVAERH